MRDPSLAIRGEPSSSTSNFRANGPDVREKNPLTHLAASATSGLISLICSRNKSKLCQTEVVGEAKMHLAKIKMAVAHPSPLHSHTDHPGPHIVDLLRRRAPRAAFRFFERKGSLRSLNH